VSLAGTNFQACSFIRLLLAREFIASYDEMSRRSGNLSEDVLPRKRRLEGLLKELDAP